MRSLFRDLRFEAKLRLLIVATTLAALITAGLVYGASDYLLTRRSLMSEVASLAEVLATHSVGALDFQDEAVATDILASLALSEDVVAAGLFESGGRLLASYGRAGTRRALRPNLHADEHSYFAGGTLHVVRPVRFNDRLLGHIYIEADLSKLWDRAAWFGATAFLVLLVCTAFSFAIASRLQHIVSKPVLRLVALLRRVSRERDYSLRAEKTSNDELGLLTDDLNDMIAKIELHDAEQEQARRALEGRAAELARSNEALDDFAYIASHDLKEPLRGIHNYSRFLQEDYGEQLDAEGQHKLETLGRLAVRMEGLIDTLLHYSRVGRTGNAIGPTDLDAVLHDVLDTLRPRLDEEGVDVRVPRPLPVVVCDAVRVGEVFRNFLTNGMKYSTRDERWIEVTWREERPPEKARQILCPQGVDTHPVFTVRDNGIGIREKHLDSVFRMFKRLHARDRYGGGTGAGLSIVKKIIEQHQGGLWLESVFGEGTAFHFSVGTRVRQEN